MWLRNDRQSSATQPYALRPPNNADVRVRFDPESRRISGVEGADSATDDIQESEDDVLGVPAFISVSDIPLFPSTYELGPRESVVYHSKKPPREGVYVKRDSSGLSERAK